MKTLEELRTRQGEIIDEQDLILKTADDDDKRDLTDEEEARFNELQTELKALDADADTLKKKEERQAELDRRKAELKKPVRQPPRMAATFTPENPEEFKNFGEFIHAVTFNPADRRLYDFEAREQSMGTGVEGGFMVPTQFLGTLLSYSPQEAIFRPRCTVIPAGTPPDSEISMPALDQGTGENIYGGFEFGWVSEGGAKPETDIKLKEVTWKPHEVAGYVTITDKLLRNWAAASSVIENQMRLAKIGIEDSVFYNGDGVGKPLGILNSAARIDYTRATANQISFADIAGMYARIRKGMNPVWIASQTTIPQLVTIQDAASRYIWVQNAAPDLPPSLLGIPVLFSERAVALGTAGDLVLTDLSQYYIKDGSGPFVAASEHVYFTSNKTVIKMFWNVDGHPWLSEPIPLEGSTSNTVSPFVVLN